MLGYTGLSESRPGTTAPTHSVAQSRGNQKAAGPW